MSHLFDTQVLLWALYDQKKLSVRARKVLMDPQVQPYFSAISVLEVSIKTARGRADFVVDPKEFVTQLRLAEFSEIDMTSMDAIRFFTIPVLHKDPFDRILVAQAAEQNFTLVTADKTIATYPGNILKV